MNFLVAGVYDNYVSANLAKGLLESGDIKCWLRDENIVAVEPGITYAVGGIKLMVAENDLDKARDVLSSFKPEKKLQEICPNCGSANTKSIPTPAKPKSLIGTIANVLLSGGSSAADHTTFHCLDCGHRFESSNE